LRRLCCYLDRVGTIGAQSLQHGWHKLLQSHINNTSTTQTNKQRHSMHTHAPDTCETSDPTACDARRRRQFAARSAGRTASVRAAPYRRDASPNLQRIVWKISDSFVCLLLLLLFYLRVLTISAFECCKECTGRRFAEPRVQFARAYHNRFSCFRSSTANNLKSIDINNYTIYT
jgi:hypothetical protein